MSSPDIRCFHCGEPVPTGSTFRLELQEESLPMCCAGCLAVSSLIHDAGFERYYRFRQSLARRASDDLEQARAAWRSCDAKQSLWGQPTDAGRYEVMLQTEGIQCAACAWLIRSQLGRLPGIDDVQVDMASGLTHITWDPVRTRLSDMALALYGLGYKPHLPLASEQERARREERKRSLRRLGIAGLGMMQVMMYAVGLYAGEALGMSTTAERFLEWVSLLVTTPVLLYSGRVFFEGAWRGLRSGRPGMDVPVALAIGIAYLASCVAFFSGRGEVWFDSVVMFIFFLLLGRHVEMSLRHRNQQSGAVLARLLPEWVQRLTAAGAETVLASELEPGDRVRVRVGEAFPADGEVLNGETEVNEALLTGESFPRPRRRGDAIIAGSINLLQPVDVRVTAAGLDTTVSALGRLIEKARARRTGVTLLAERIANRFVAGVLLLSGTACAWWLAHEPGMAMSVTLAVLVVSCPCALSLAAPSAVAAASRAMLKRGIILTRGEALEGLAAIDRVLFDKTGTLTSGQPEVVRVTLNPERQDMDQRQVMRLAAALESASAHPLAQAFTDPAPLTLERVETAAGQGMRGWLDGREYRIGTRDFASPNNPAPDCSDGHTWLSDTDGWLAVFELRDRLRTGARAAVDYFRHAGVTPMILSGDSEAKVRQVAEELKIDQWQAGLRPEAKLEALAGLKARDHVLLMVGDGVNDAPVLAAADVSIAVQGGAELANSAADMILTGRSLDLVRQARELALDTRTVTKQNMIWAVLYNVTMIPLAASGLLEPWMAAIGMSASSLLVVLNAARLGRGAEVSAGGLEVEPVEEAA
jgi:Cu2+-exporting ATPase